MVPHRNTGYNNFFPRFSQYIVHDNPAVRRHKAHEIDKTSVGKQKTNKAVGKKN
jgi:hypothetical protein